MLTAHKQRKTGNSAMATFNLWFISVLKLQRD